MAQAQNQELVDRFEQFYRNYYRDEIGELAKHYPSEQRSLHIDWQDLYRFDPDLADDYLAQPDQLREFAEEALRVYDLPVDVTLAGAHIRIHNLPEVTEIRAIRSPDVNTLVSIQGIVRKATAVRPKIQEAAFECQRCGTLTYIPQTAGFQDPHECQGCERQGPFTINYDQSTFVDAQKLRIQESPEGLRGGETPESLDVNIEDDITGRVTPGDHVTMTGVLRIEQQRSGNEKSRMFDVYMDGHSLVVEDEEFESMDITEADKQAISELAQSDGIYQRMVDSIAPTIYGYDEEKFAIVLQLFSGVTKHLPDESRIRGDLHLLLVGDPGTGKCVHGDTTVALADGTTVPIRDLVEQHLEDPTPIDDGVYDTVDIPLPTMDRDGRLVTGHATKVWKREAPDPMYRVTTTAGDTIDVTPSHPLFVDSGIGYLPVEAARLSAGDHIAAIESTTGRFPLTDGGRTPVPRTTNTPDRAVRPIEIESIHQFTPDYDWVYDLEVAETHAYISNGIVSHNSQILQYIRHISPRSVYTSGKGTSAAGITAAAIRDDFADGNQWSLEAGALVLADKGVAAIDELDKMRCVTGDTRVHLADRGIVRLQDLAVNAAAEGRIESHEHGRTIRGFDARAFTMTEDGRVVVRPVSALHEYDAPAELVEVTLESGEMIRTTEDHPFFVVEGGARETRAAVDLQAGDYTVVPPATPPTIPDGGGVDPINNTNIPVASRVKPAKIRRIRRVTPPTASTPKVYDLTVEGTHNYVANGMVVHNSEDRSALHEALEQQTVSISKAGINATLKSRCSLLGAANPKYGRFDQYEPIAEQIELDPALISRFDLIFTVTDQPDEEQDAALAEHILQTNYAGELHSQVAEQRAAGVSQEEVQAASADVEPAIEPELFRKYIAYAKRHCFPTMTAGAREVIRDFYVDLRARGTDEDAPVPVTARKLEALVRLSEASARVRLSDTVEREDAERVIEVVRSSLRNIGVDPETGEFDVDMIETGTSKSQRDRIKSLRALIAEMEDDYDEGAPVSEVIARAEEVGIDESKAEHEIEKLRQRGEVYEPAQGYLRTT